MFFEIENTPEHIRRARRKAVVKKESPKEDCPRLILAPFSRPPLVIFDNVLIGETCKRELELCNPSKQMQKITLGKALPPGFIIHLPDAWLDVEPETCYSLIMEWTPTQPTALKETIRFTNEFRGRYDITVILKSVMNVKGKSKGYKISPGKMKKKSFKKSPVAIYKQKTELIYNSTKVRKSVSIVQRDYKNMKSSNKENVSSFIDNDLDVQDLKCPFDSPTSIDLNFNTSEIFSNMRKSSKNTLHSTYDALSETDRLTKNIPSNILKPSNTKVCDNLDSDLFDNLTFTPLKSLATKTDKLEKGPKIVLSMNSDSELDDSLNVKTFNKENEPHSIVHITSHPPNKWVNINHHMQTEIKTLETSHLQHKKIPNTSSPKELNSPNFSINTELSHISDLSFAPQRCSTERKNVLKLNNDTHDIFDDKLSSDTYTKESPNTPIFLTNLPYESKPPHYFSRDNPKMCKQALFREYQLQKESLEKKYIHLVERNIYQDIRRDYQDIRRDYQDIRREMISPPRSLSPPLQSIPEESTQFTESQIHDKTNEQMATFTIDRTFDKIPDRNSVSSSTNSTWSKKAIRAEPEIWKVPVSFPRKSLKPKASLTSKDSLSGRESYVINKSINQNISLNQIGNVYSQSLTVDPFMSSTYFYDEEAVEKFEKEFKRWLNYILTPPADLDSNIEQKIDVGKAWLENRNKEIPAAPTKEYVSSVYHNSHRLESLRKTAKALLINPEFVQVVQKLNAQIEKKLIAIRTDRNLHLDVGLQKIIMELLLSYNPLWLRIGLEAIYNLVLPLKSNSDIDGLTTFIIQRMFKNPFLKNKHSKSNAPNVLLPAYMEAIKKFTLKKFFLLVYFLDQAKQRKIIPHDPCLFCRNAICKESREIIIRFTRELIAGIGDITKHLRPIGYVVSHKQTYLDEFKYAVHNIAVDIRDGVRLTKVMEIILMKNGLLNQLRTPAISRLQKIHNVQVALNALKEANFVIVGDITATDIADGHREKTLSLLWQIIHVFRAPLFEKAAIVIQMWWKKKYEIIVERKKEEERIHLMRNKAASIIQYWWRRTQYKRLVEWQMSRIISATIIIQKYCRRWLCRSRLLKLKTSVAKIENWYRSVKLIKEAKNTLQILKLQREERRRQAATVIQSHVRRWLCMKDYNKKVKRIIQIQSLVRRYMIRKKYKQLLKVTRYIQQHYRNKLLMRKEMQIFNMKRKMAIIIQSYYRMFKQRMNYLKLKQTVRIIEERYLALIKMRQQRHQYEKMKAVTIKLQSLYRGRKCRTEYMKKRNLIIKMQLKVKSRILMKKQRQRFLQIKNAAIVLQKHIRAYLAMKKDRREYVNQRQSVILIQQQYRAYRLGKYQRNYYIKLRNAAIALQRRYRGLVTMRKDRSDFLMLKKSVINIQRRFRAQILMKQSKQYYENLRDATIVFQRRYRALLQMRAQREWYQKYRSTTIKIQNIFRANVLCKHCRQQFIKKKNAAILIQNWFRNLKKTSQIKQNYQETKKACITIQRVYRAVVIGRKQRNEYIRIRTATVRIQKYYRAYVEMKTVREQYIKLKTATVTIQRYYRSHLIAKQQRSHYLKIKTATLLIQESYRRYKLTKLTRIQFCELKRTTLYIQQKYRANRAMRNERSKYLKLRQTVRLIQARYRANLAMRSQRQAFLKLRAATITIQRKFKAQALMKKERTRYCILLKACVIIQRYVRATLARNIQRQEYLNYKKAALVLQNRFRALLAMRENRKEFLRTCAAVITVQRRYRALCRMKEDRAQFLRTVRACLVIQRAYRAYILRKRAQYEYLRIKSAVLKIQNWYRNITVSKKVRMEYRKLLCVVITTQRLYRLKIKAREARRVESAKKIQTWYRAVRTRNECRNEYMKIRRSVIILQSAFRMYTVRKKFLKTKNAALTIQKYYRSYKQTLQTKQQYMKLRIAIICLQSYVRGFIERKRYHKVLQAIVTIQSAYREKKRRDILKQREIQAAICIQKHVRRYLVQTKYQNFRRKIISIQELWRGKLITRLLRCEFLQKRRIIIKLQALSRGYLVRKQVQLIKEEKLKRREEQKRHWAATKIQALFRGHRERLAFKGDSRVAELRRRWREGGLESQQESLKQRNEEVLELLTTMSDIETIIRVFRSLALLTEVMPMTYNTNASSIVRRVYDYMSVMNRSISSVEVLKYAASVLVNLTRYRVTGPKIYKKNRIPPILKFMWRFSNSETHLFCVLTTHLWLFAKYDAVREDLKEFLHIPEYHKMLVTIKGNVERTKRMEQKSRNKFHTPQPTKFISHTGHMSMNHSICSNSSTCKYDIMLPALEPDYGIVRADKPRYFEDPLQAITCLFQTYNL